MEFNFISPIVAGILGFGFGNIWFGELMFERMWREAAGKSPDSKQPPEVFIKAAAVTVISAFGLALLMSLLEIQGAQNGAEFGAMVAIFIFMPSSYVNYVFDDRSNTQYFIETGYVVFSRAIMGMVIGGWPW